MMINATIWTPAMNRFLPLSIVCLALGLQGKLAAQEPAMGQSATAPASSTNQAPAELTPPPDNAPPSTAPDQTSTTTTTTTTTSAETKPPETPKSTSTPLTPQEIARIQQQEIIRRQELVFQANDHLATAQQQEAGQNYPEARKNYLFAAEAYGTISRSTTDYAKSADGLTRVDFKLYDDALKFGDMARAKLLIDEVVKYNPNNQEANKRLAEVDHMLADPNDTTLLGNPAVTPALVKKVDEIQQLFAEAEQFRRTGQWDQAEERLKRIEGIDPYNKAAALQLERIDKAKDDYAEQARLETRDERLRQVEEKWYEPVINKDDLTSPQEGQETLVRATTFNIDQQLRSIFVSLDFSPGTTIEQATTYLSIKSKTLDPQHKGVNFIIQPEASTSAKTISLTLNNVPLGEALRYICQLANVKFKVQDYAISIVPFSQNTDDLISRTFIVQPNFVAPPSAVSTASVAATIFGGGGANGARPLPPAVAPGGTGDTGTETSADPVRAALEAKGVKFPPGASAVYTSNTGQLTIVNTADQMELIEELVNAGQAPTYMVRISTKFVEINQNDLNDLTFNTALNFLNLGGAVSTNILTASGYNTSLPGSRAISPDSIDALISPPAITSNQLYFSAFLSAAQYNLIINALSQKKSMDVLSEPFTLTKSGEQGVLEAVRVFPYPTAFDPPELETINNTGLGLVVVRTPPAVVATTPTDFKRRNIGVRLVIKPQISADNQTVDLALFPEVTEFDGFINYGSKIYVGNPDGSTSLLSNNVINQPVFDTRRINTKVLIKDGSTVVMGGLIREDLQTINDRVPFFGDLPLVGRLFQSKAVQSTKRNLIIFVSANIYRTDGELLNPPEEVDAADVLTGRASLVPAGTP